MKSEVFDCFRNLKNIVEREIERKIKCLRPDGGTEYFSGQFNNYLQQMRIQHEFSCRLVDKMLEEKDGLILRLRQQLAKQQEATRQNAEQVEELEEYVKIQETYFAEQIVVKDILLTELNEKHSQEQNEWASAK